MKTFKDLKVGDYFYYAEPFGDNRLDKHKIEEIKHDDFFVKFKVKWKGIGLTYYVIPKSSLNKSFDTNYGMYVDPKYILKDLQIGAPKIVSEEIEDLPFE